MVSHIRNHSFPDIQKNTVSNLDQSRTALYNGHSLLVIFTPYLFFGKKQFMLYVDKLQ